MKIFKNTYQVIKIIMRNSTIYCLIYLSIIIFSSLLIPIQIIYTEKMIKSIINNSNSILLYSIILLISIVGVSILNTINSIIKPRFENHFYIKFMPEIYSKNSKIDYIEFEKSNNQDMFNNLTSNPSINIMYIFYEFTNLTFYVASLFGIIISFFTMSKTIGLIALIVSLPMYITECKGVNDEIKYRWNMTKEIRKRSYIQSLFVDRNALQEIKIYNERDYLFMKSDELTHKINNDLMRVVKKSITLTSISSFIMIIFLSVIFFISTYYCVQGVLVISIYVAILTALKKFISTSKSSAYSFSSFTRQIKYMEIYERFMLLPEVITKSNNIENSDRESIEIEFRNVTFKYPNSSSYVLENINLKISNNEKIALVGENGCGKSTLIKLICGLYKPDSGEILINGKSIDTFNNDNFRYIFSVAFQDYKQFQLSLRENISLGELNELNNDIRLIENLKFSKLDYLLENEDKLDLYLGKIYDNGIELSHGEWQKIAISRILLNPKKFVVLDEPAASLDSIIENQMYEFIYNNFQHLGMILVTHRLASIKLVDRIIVMEKGKIIEDGKHLELMDKKGYYNMYFVQSGWYKDDVVE